MYKASLKFIFLFIINLFFVFGCSDAYLDLLGIGDNSSGNNGNSGDNVSYTVSFNSNGGTGEMKSVTVSSGKYKLPLNTYYYEGFNFTGWSNSSDGELLYGDGEEIEVSSNITLYALWQEEPSSGIETYYTITYDSNGGTGIMESKSALQGKRVQLDFNNFIKTNYTFIGWSLSNDNIPVLTDGGYITVTGNITLYACWQENIPPVGTTYTVYYHSNNGEGYMIPTTASSGSYVQLSPNGFNRAGFSFAGWSKSPDGQVEYNDKSSILLTDNITLYAVWTALAKYKITYHSNTGSQDVVKVVEKYAPLSGNVIYLDRNEFTNGDMKFIGWSLSSSSSESVYQDGAPLSALTQDIDLYALWDSNPVVIKFSANGGTGSMPELYAKKGDKIILPEADFTREGYVLKGNFYQLDIDIYNYYTFNSEYEVTDNATFSVLWVELPKPDEPISGGNSEIYKNTTVWVDGVTVKDKDWVNSFVEGLQYAVRKDDSGWYDTDQYFFNLCWAGASSNLLHWWYDRNKESIEKYFKEYAPEGTVPPNMTYKGWGVSTIFQDYVKKWPNHGGYIDTGLEWYLVGSNQNGGGAYFKEVFGDDTSFVEFYGALNQYKFNTAMNKAFENKMAVGASEIGFGGSHAITIWGAHYDENGLIDRIYVSDSATSAGNNTPGKVETGLMGIDIVYSFDDIFGKVYMKNYMGGLLPLASVTLFDNCNDRWEEYFRTHSPRVNK